MPSEEGLFPDTEPPSIWCDFDPPRRTDKQLKSLKSAEVGVTSSPRKPEKNQVIDPVRPNPREWARIYKTPDPLPSCLTHPTAAAYNRVSA